MNIKEYMEKEIEALKYAVPQLRDMQTDYFKIIEDLVKVLEQYADEKRWYLDEGAGMFSTDASYNDQKFDNELAEEILNKEIK